MTHVFQDQINVQQSDSHTYQVGGDPEWAIGPSKKVFAMPHRSLPTFFTVIHGGCVTACVYAAAEKHFNTTLTSHKQPDVHTLHAEFLRPVTVAPSTIKV